MQIPFIASASLIILILIQAVLVPLLMKNLNNEEKQKYEQSHKLYLNITEVILAFGIIFAYIFIQNSILVYLLGLLFLAVTIYDSFSSSAKVRVLDINEDAKRIVLIKNTIYVIFAIIFVGSLIYQQSLR